MIRVNGEEISDGAVLAEMQYHPADTVEAARAAAEQALVVRALLLQQAERTGIDPDLDEEARIAALLDQAITTPEADEPTCRRYYEANRKRFVSPDLYEGAHILLPAASGDSKARAAARHTAEALIAQLVEEPSRFAALAREHSACSSRDNGGRLGQIARGDTVAELETFMFALEEGQICPVPVATRYGIHVIRLDRKVRGRMLPFSAVRERIAAYLRERAWRQAVAQYVKILAGGADLEGTEIARASSPLVQ